MPHRHRARALRARRASTLPRRSQSKILTLNGLRRVVSSAHRAGRCIVFTNGCFDLLHVGHVRYLEAARRLGDILVVGINDDRSVRRLKGAPRPLQRLMDRSRIVASLESVDWVVPFGELTPLRLIRQVRPTVLVKGGDWVPEQIVGGAFVASYGGKVRTIPFVPGRSTTRLVQRMSRVSR